MADYQLQNKKIQIKSNEIKLIWMINDKMH